MPQAGMRMPAVQDPMQVAQQALVNQQALIMVRTMYLYLPLYPCVDILLLYAKSLPVCTLRPNR